MSGCAILTIDPGGKSGLAWGWFNLEADSVGSAIRRAKARGSFHSMELSGDPVSQGLVCAALYYEFVFKSHTEYGLPYSDIHVVVEDFQLRQKHAELSPVEITAVFEACLRQEVDLDELRKTDHPEKTDHAVKVRTISGSCVSVEPSRQQPSAAMTYATNQRLRDWGAWVVGSEHARDAVRHLCVKLSELLS